MRLFLVLMIFLLPLSNCYAQNSFSLNTTTGLNFGFDTPSELEADMVKQNALVVNINPKSQSISVYARISNYSAPSGFDGSSMGVRLDETSISSTSNVSNLVTGAIDLSLTDVMLFSIKKKNNNYSVYYNLIVTAPGYSTPVGHYNFTLTFTMTQP